MKLKTLLDQLDNSKYDPDREVYFETGDTGCWLDVYVVYEAEEAIEGTSIKVVGPLLLQGFPPEGIK